MDSLGIDKLYHLIAGFIIASVVYMFLGTNWAIGSTLVAGIGKEVYDYISSTYWGASHSVDILDAFATVLGGIVAVGLGAWVL